MTYFIAYLALGAVVLGVALISHRQANPPQSDFVREMMAAVDPERATLRYRLLHRLVVPALAGVLMLVAWPVAVFIKVREIVAGRPEDPGAAPEPAVFGVSRDELLCEMTLEEIESAETISDPLGAVPSLPFGHLNAVWSRFRSELAQGDTIWRFAALRDGKWGAREMREGYVISRGEGLGPYFLTGRRPVERPEAGEQGQ